ncbi:hypothetical protein [Nocardiopsis ansamitocini]|uniref:Uncharacterized protein n=1 Tax=Nocardiopsis ansamitocini TaxID=1670832 RepID=A0A9W6P6M9_9ACTN|nr:hypothetical protein [Nocardiopsis ansamitocini]GLU47978.1 hypothetical protein Nans01_23290 [Nocardiopsis ansamitocini]
MPSIKSTDVSTTIVQLIKGGEPDDAGVSLAGMVSPLTPTLGLRQCACCCVPMPYDLWETLDRHDLYSRDTDLWIRTILPGDTAPLPKGAVILQSRTVSCSVS